MQVSEHITGSGHRADPTLISEVGIRTRTSRRGLGPERGTPALFQHTNPKL